MHGHSSAGTDCGQMYFTYISKKFDYQTQEILLQDKIIVMLKFILAEAEITRQCISWLGSSEIRPDSSSLSRTEEGWRRAR